MITLITGTPGAGKTLFAVKMLVEELLPQGRRIFTNITGLNIADPLVTICDDRMPLEWMGQQDGAIFVFDECQRQYPPRHSTSRVPDWIAAFQTHRHRGFDFYLITQSPKLIDGHIREMTERHLHLFRAFGWTRSTIYDWGAVNLDPQPPQSRSNALTKNFTFPKKYFDLYRSASVHTVKARLPWKWIVIIGGALVVVLGAVWFTLSWVTGMKEKHAVALAPAAETAAADLPCGFQLRGKIGSDLVAVFPGGRLRVIPADLVTRRGRKTEVDVPGDTVCVLPLM